MKSMEKIITRVKRANRLWIMPAFLQIKISRS